MNASTLTYRKRTTGRKTYAAGAAVVAALLTSTACGPGAADSSDEIKSSDRPNAASPAEPGGTASAEEAPADEPVAMAAAAFTNRVATFNVDNPSSRLRKGRHLNRIVNEIARYRPQVIALQEICVKETNAIVERLRKKGYTYRVAHGSVTRHGGRCLGYGTSYGNAILSAAPLTGKKNTRYTRPSTDRDDKAENRGHVSAYTTVAGKKVRVFATHLSEGGQRAERNAQIKELLVAVKKHPNAIVLGDFNATPTYSEMKPVWKEFRDADPKCNAARSGPPCKPTLGKDTSPNRKKFDYILLRKGGRFSASGVGVHPNYSNHDLVHADLRAR
ncbi:endonuclease/exonuclease/phosphatase family protein [Streptomyces sp. NPDC085927]|uniref:endonuclease/exonuclease/phosphatase family protein n=1 Tax=Streptomyces sp. NPDC085927 TaxID=3365738 RepID=UPI0037D8E87C